MIQPLAMIWGGAPVPGVSGIFPAVISVNSLRRSRQASRVIAGLLSKGILKVASRAQNVDRVVFLLGPAEGERSARFCLHWR